MRQFILFIVFLTIPAFAFPATIKVPGDYPTIQQAIDASVNGDNVLVSPGTYVENIKFNGKAITVISSGGASVTVIDGGSPSNPNFGSVVTFDNGETLYSILDGFTIKNGGGTYYSAFPGYIGGGIFCDDASPTIKNCIIKKNDLSSIWPTHESVGGGVMCMYSASPIISSCIISSNTASSGGGGVYCTQGASPKITECNIINNKVTDVDSGGGGIHCEQASPLLFNCIINENSAVGEGGGISCDGTSPMIYNCFITNNTAPHGIGMFIDSTSPTILQSTINGNNASEGGAIYCEPNQPSTIVIVNSILWGDNPDEIDLNGSTINISYSDFEGGWPGMGNIDADPLFVDTTIGDFHLTYTSPCMNTGNNSAVTEPLDFEGDPRIAYGNVDMGADEYYTHLYWTGDATPGGNVELKFVGLPGTAPVGLCIGTGVLDPPLKSMWGDWYLKFPIIGPLDLGNIPSPDGVLVIPGTIPSTPPPPYSIPMQALIGAELSNLSILEVK